MSTKGITGGSRKGIGGRPKGSANKRTIEALERERIAEQAQKEVNDAYTRRKKLGKDVLEEFMLLFAGMAAYYQPVAPNQPSPPDRQPNEDKFLVYAKMAVDTADKLADYQSPKFKSIETVAPPPTINATTNPGQRADNANDPNYAARVYARLMKPVR